MRRISVVTTWLLSVFAGGCGGTSGNQAPTELFLYSIAGTFKPGPLPEIHETFHDYPVLGKIAITDPTERKTIMSVLRSSFDGNDDKLASCFWPRHAVRAVENGQTIDYLICFECARMKVYSGTSTLEKSMAATIPADLKKRYIASGVPVPPESSLKNDINVRLMGAGIPLVPGAFGEKD